METITFNETQSVDFGIVKNGVGQGGDTLCVMNGGGSLAGDACIKASGNGGIVELTGTGNQSIWLGVTSDGITEGTEFIPQLWNGRDPGSNGPTVMPGSGTLLIEVGGELVISAGAGARALTYTITANYQ